MQACFFKSPADLRSWFETHAASEQELLVGYYKRGTSKPSVTWLESVDEALCFGWIDGVRRRIDDQRYTIRFTPRKPRSIWTALYELPVLAADERHGEANRTSTNFQRKPTEANRTSTEATPDSHAISE